MLCISSSFSKLWMVYVSKVKSLLFMSLWLPSFLKIMSKFGDCTICWSLRDCSNGISESCHACNTFIGHEIWKNKKNAIFSWNYLDLTEKFAVIERLREVWQQILRCWEYFSAFLKSQSQSVNISVLWLKFFT